MKRLYLLVISLICMQLAYAQCPTPNNYTGVGYIDGSEIGAHLAWDRAVYESTLDRFEIYRSDDGEYFVMVKRIVNTPSISHYECMDQVDNPGVYFYKIIAFYQNGCESDPLTIEVNVTDHSLVDEEIVEDIELFPNPTSGVITVKAENMQAITIINAMGQTMMAQDVDNDEVLIDMSAFESGMYLVGIKTENGNVVKVLNVLR